MTTKLETIPRKERAYEKYDWILLMVAPLLISFLNIEGLVYGYSSEAPTNLLSGEVTASTSMATFRLLNYIARGGAAGSLTLMLLVLAIAATAYRRGERWAWFIEFYVFVAAIVVVAMEVSEGQNNWIGVLVLGTPSLLGLVLPYRKFFPRKQRV